MLKQFLQLSGIIICCISIQSFAQDGARVTGVISPAWVVQQNNKIALKPGYQISPSDTIETAAGGRIQMAFSNDAEFQLGEQAEFIAHQLESGSTATEPYEGFVEVFKGAFRYIGEVFGPGPQKTNFRVNVGFSTIGLRGTDFWGVTDRTTDTIVLIDGAITVTPDNGQPFTMDNPQTIVQNVVGSGAGTIDSVDAETLGKSAAQTVLTQGKGVLTEAGQYQVVLGSLSSRPNALNYAAKIDEQGFPAAVEFSPARNSNRILVSGFSTLEDAQFFAQNTAKTFGVNDAWIKKPN